MVRRLLLLILCLLPLAGLFHRDETWRWTINREAFISPDEFSYLLTAENIAAGRGIALKHLPADTFYPPGFPLLLAAWSKCFGTGIAAMHTAVTLLGCVSVAAVYAVVRRMLGEARGNRQEVTGDRNGIGPLCPGCWAGEGVALAVTALYATSYHFLEVTLYIASEPAFILATMLWLLAALHWRYWWTNWRQTLAVALLAAVATSMRSAGIVCFATTLAFPWLDAWLGRRLAPGTASRISRAMRASGIVVLVMLAYYGTIHVLSPEKSIATTSGNNSYTQQLINGITDGHQIPLWNLPRLAVNVGHMVLPHFEDWAGSFVPPPRESPRFGPFNVIAKLSLLVAGLGWLWQLLARRREASRFVEVYVLFYAALYAVWPFDFIRFWVPILPLMLAYAALVLRGSAEENHRAESAALATLRRPRVSPWLRPLYGLLIALLLTLNVEEMLLKLPFYQRRIDYVSDCLRGAGPAIAHAGGDAERDVLLSVEPFTFFYYTRLPQQVPQPRERLDKAVLRLLNEAEANEAAEHPKIPAGRRVYVASYFDTPGDFPAALQQVRDTLPPGAPWTIRRLYRRDMVSLWEIRRTPVP